MNWTIPSCSNLAASLLSLRPMESFTLLHPVKHCAISQSDTESVLQRWFH